MAKFSSLDWLDDPEFLAVAKNYNRETAFPKRTQIIREGCEEGSVDFGRYYFYRKGVFITYDPRTQSFPGAKVMVSIRGPTYKENEYYSCDIMPYVEQELRPGLSEDDILKICALVDDIATLILGALEEALHYA